MSFTRLPSKLKGSGANMERIEELRDRLAPTERERVPPGQFVTEFSGTCLPLEPGHAAFAPIACSLGS